MKRKIDTIWKKQESFVSKEVQREKIKLNDFIECYIGLIGISGARMFQVELSKEIEIHKNYINRFKGVEIQALPRNSDVNEFIIFLKDKDLSDIFTLFITDILDHLSLINSTEDILLNISYRVRYWKRLFARYTGEILSNERQRGLFGELYFLKKILEVHENKRDILETWCGAYGANQDFICNRNAIEVKTTKSSGFIVHISNELQLDYSTLNILSLVLIRVNETRGGQFTLCELIIKIIEELNEGFLIDEFKNKISEAGIPEDMIEYYDYISYSIRNCNYYRVSEGFPIVSRQNLMSNSISNVKYEINLVSCEDFLCEEDLVINSIL